MSKNFDAIIIGAGQAGPPLAGRLAGAGMSVALIERKLFGGTCVNTGCVPTKTLVASAYAAHLARRAHEYGVKLSGAVAVDMKAVRVRKEEILLKSRNGIEAWLKGMARCTVMHGHARFIGPRELEERDGAMIFSNHSCEPNIGVQGQIVFVALRPIPPGEELAHDWATTDDDEYTLECRCGAPTCRRIVTGKDWKRQDMQRKYRGYFSWYLQRLIDAE